MTTHDTTVLFAKLRTLASAVFDAAPSSGGRIRVRHRAVFEERPDGNFVTSHSIEAEVDWPRVSIEDWIASMDPFAAVRDELGGFEHVKSWIATRVHAPDPIQVREIGLRNLVREFIGAVCQRDAWAIDEDRWLRATAAMKLLIDHGKVEHRWLVLLHGVRFASEVTVGDALLRLPTRQELLDAFDRGTFEGVDNAVMSCKAVIAAAENVPLGTQSVLGQRIETITRALRVWTGWSIAQIVTLQGQFMADGGGASRPLGKAFPIFARHRDLPSPEAFSDFWERTRAILSRPPSALGVALRRMELMIDQERDADRVLDLCIILEALFQLGNEKQELSYRLSLRTAHFVGRDRVDRRNVFDAVRKGYDLRSRIAHGEVATAEDRAAQTELEELTLRALRA